MSLLFRGEVRQDSEVERVLEIGTPLAAGVFQALSWVGAIELRGSDVWLRPKGSRTEAYPDLVSLREAKAGEVPNRDALLKLAASVKGEILLTRMQVMAGYEADPPLSIRQEMRSADEDTAPLSIRPTPGPPGPTGLRSASLMPEGQERTLITHQPAMATKVAKAYEMVRVPASSSPGGSPVPLWAVRAVAGNQTLASNLPEGVARALTVFLNGEDENPHLAVVAEELLRLLTAKEEQAAADEGQVTARMLNGHAADVKATEHLDEVAAGALEALGLLGGEVA